jgi:hypothetical protein
VGVEQQEVKVGARGCFPFYSDVAHRIAAVISRDALTGNYMQLDCISLRQLVTFSKITAEFRLCGEVIHVRHM